MPDTPKPNPEKLPRTSIIRRRGDFTLIRTKGHRVRSSFLTLNWLLNGPRQLGIITPKSIGNAVIRNKVKRRIREIYRRLQTQLPENLKSVWIARPKTATLAYKDLENEMINMYQKAGFTPRQNQ